MAEERLTFVGRIRRVSPPWLRRLNAARVMEGIADVLDEQVDRLVQGIKLRFPGAPPRDPDPGALALTGRERRIRRGPGESAATYARRVRIWLDSHRTRGGPYALLEQLYAFFLDWLNVRMDVVYWSGTRRWIDEDGVITRDSITWSASGPADGPAVKLAANALPGATEVRPQSMTPFLPHIAPFHVRLVDAVFPSTELAQVDAVELASEGAPYDRLVLSAPITGSYIANVGEVAVANARWAHVWVFLYVPDLIPGADAFLVTADEDGLVTADLDALLATSSISPADITDAEAAIFTAIPREWSAAHIPYVTVVLLYGDVRLWGYPQPVPTWGTWGTWQSTDPVQLVAE